MNETNKKKYWLRGLVAGVIVSIIPAIFVSYFLFTAEGIPFSGYTPKTIAGDPMSYLRLSIFFWAIFGSFLGLIGLTIGWIYGKQNKSIKHWIIVASIFLGIGVLLYYYFVGF